MPYRDLDHPRRAWCLLSGQGLVLAAVAASPAQPMRQLAHDLDYAERRITTLLRELEATGMVTRTRRGRHSHYTICPAASARIRSLPGVTVGDVLRGVQRQSQEA